MAYNRREFYNSKELHTLSSRSRWKTGLVRISSKKAASFRAISYLPLHHFLCFAELSVTEEQALKFLLFGAGRYQVNYACLLQNWSFHESTFHKNLNSVRTSVSPYYRLLKIAITTVYFPVFQNLWNPITLDCMGWSFELKNSGVGFQILQSALDCGDLRHVANEMFSNTRNCLKSWWKLVQEKLEFSARGLT